jgi:hypothetical protein
MIDYTVFDNEVKLANDKSGLSDGNAIASSQSIEHLIRAIEALGDIVKQLDTQTKSST